MVGAAAYDFMYRRGAIWDAAGVRPELSSFLDRGLVTAKTHPRVIDLGCGTGSNAVHLAGLGFEVTGVDFSAVALAKAEARAAEAGVECRFVLGDLTADAIPGAAGPFDFLVDFGTLDDLKGDARRRMASTIDRLSAPGSVLLEWCFYASAADLPWFSMSGPSRLIGAIAPGELDEMFGARWDIETLASDPEHHNACFLMGRR
ncbi:MAG: class I SAM-dependent methyltransferase [Acidimicrobiia bacterium]|jgi:SAM-dependent methyltransferase